MVERHETRGAGPAPIWGSGEAAGEAAAALCRQRAAVRRIHGPDSESGCDVQTKTSVRRWPALPKFVEHLTTKHARWYFPRGIRRVRILHRPKDEVLHILLGPFLGDGG